MRAGARLLLLFRNCKPAGDSGVLSEPFKIDGRMVMTKQTLFIHIAESTLEERRQRQKITSSLSHIFAKEPLAAEFTTRKHFASNVIGPVSYDVEWSRTVKDKREIYGKD